MKKEKPFRLECPRCRKPTPTFEQPVINVKTGQVYAIQRCGNCGSRLIRKSGEEESK